MTVAASNRVNPSAEREYHETSVIAQILMAPGNLASVDLLDLGDLQSPDHRAWLKAFRVLAKSRGALTGDDLPAVFEAVSDLSKQPLPDVAARAAVMIEGVFSTANTRNDAIKLKRLSIERRLNAAMKACDLEKTRAILVELDALSVARSGKHPDRFNAADLMRMEFPDPEWLLPDLLPEVGLYLLCGKPKSGKSWLSLGLGMALAQGGSYLGRETPRRKVCCFALEDTPRRLKGRLEKLHIGSPDDLEWLDIRTSAPRLGNGLEHQIRQAADDGYKLVILDTLQKIRPPASKHGTQYGDDYAVLGAIKEIADSCGICVLVIHHLRKAESLDDPFDDISGTNGVAGSADGALILRRVHGKPEATLHVTGRDMPDNEFGIRFDDGLWQYAGTAAEVRTTAEQAGILELLKSYGSDGATIKTICADTRKERRNVAKLLGKVVDAGLVRVRRAKPADFYAICDGPMAGDTIGTPTRMDPLEREPLERESGGINKSSSTGSTGSIGATGSTGSTPPQARGGTGGTGGTEARGGTMELESKANSGTCGHGGTGGTGGTANHNIGDGQPQPGEVWIPDRAKFEKPQ